MAARELRYNWFRKLLEDHRFTSVATAHHLDDMAETMLINLTHGRSLDGLAGIPLKREGIIRPLLFANRAQIEGYATENGITWREDYSNYTDDYERNFLRHRVLPLLKELNPSLIETWTRTSERARLELSLLTETLDNWKAQHLRSEGGTWRVSKQSLSDNKFNPLYLSHALGEFGFNHSQCAALVDVSVMQTGKMMTSQTHHLVVDRDEIIVSVVTPAIVEVYIQEEQQESSNGFARLSFEKRSDTTIPPSPQVAVVDFDKVTFPLTWRPWREGDRFQPLGMSGSKKISDFLIDQKVPRTAKEKITVLESGGEIIWVVGLRVDQRVRVEPGTRSVLMIRESVLN
jgi:tRNA(Ile)-lysidine synthase